MTTIKSKGGKKPAGTRGKTYAIYWATTEDHDEDWFIVATSAREARRGHENAEGYDRGDAEAERIVTIPAHLQGEEGWFDPGKKTWSKYVWPSDDLLVACGFTITEMERDAFQERLGCVCKTVTYKGRVFRAGDITENVLEHTGVSRDTVNARIKETQKGLPL
jgi:hypothetical protein